MKGDPQVLQYLNRLLTNELTSTNQYFLHARMFGNWGFHKLEEHEKHESIDEMKHADALIQRILFLEGLPNLQDLGKLMIGENVPEALQCDLNMERAAHALFRDAIAHCETVRDYVTRNLLREILDSEEEHVHWIETQLELVQPVGLPNYLQVADVAQTCAARDRADARCCRAPRVSGPARAAGWPRR